MVSGRRYMPLLLVAAALAAALLAAPELVVPGVLSCAPAFALLGCLWLGRFPGHERLVRWMARRRHARRPRPRLAVPIVRFAPVRFPRGGRLLGSQLAVRPPPVAVRPAA